MIHPMGQHLYNLKTKPPTRRGDERRCYRLLSLPKRACTTYCCSLERFHGTSPARRYSYDRDQLHRVFFTLLRYLSGIASRTYTKQGHAEVVALLLEAEADATALNDDKESAVALAAKYGHEEIAVSLLDAGVREKKSNHCLGRTFHSGVPCEFCAPFASPAIYAHAHESLPSDRGVSEAQHIC